MFAGPTTELPVAFEERWRAASEALRAGVAQLVHDLQEHEQRISPRTRRRKRADAARFQLAAETLLCNLYALSLIAPLSWLAVRRGTNASKESGVFGVPFNDVLDLCEQLELVEQVKGYRVSRTVRRVSSVRSTAKLAGYWPPFPDWQDLRLVAPEPLQLREPDERGNKHAVPYKKNTHYTKAWRRDIARVNDMLARAGLARDGQPAWLEKDRDGLLLKIVTTQHAAVYRVFNNASWKQGGRLFGGWWLNMPKRERLSCIYIAGEPVAELDWSTLFLRLAYWHLEVTWPFDGRDAYCDDTDTRVRTGYKRMTNALLQADRPLRRWPGRTPDEQERHRNYFASATTATSVYDFIRARHAAVAARAFGCGLGHRLQRVESDMLIAVLLELDDMNVPALPEHDSVIVPLSQVSTVREVMQRVARVRAGLLLSVKVESSPEPQEQQDLLARSAGAPLVGSTR